MLAIQLKESYPSRVSIILVYLPKNETMTSLHVATLTVQRELPKYDLCTQKKTMAPLHVATQKFKENYLNIYLGYVLTWLHFMWLH